MTTIAYRNGILAADTRAIIGGSTMGSINKIAKNFGGSLAGAGGNAGYNYAFIEWFRNGEEGIPPEAKVTDNALDRGVIFRVDGKIEVLRAGWQVHDKGTLLCSRLWNGRGARCDVHGSDCGTGCSGCYCS